MFSFTKFYMKQNIILEKFFQSSGHFDKMGDYFELIAFNTTAWPSGYVFFSKLIFTAPIPETSTKNEKMV